jgi:curli biogenesis system outer membrane secretion channel CsgG
MKRTFAALSAAMALLATASLAVPAHAQAKRPQVAITDFDYGTVGYHWWGDADIGKGMADQLANALVEDSSFRVIERKKLDTVLAEQDFTHSDRADPSQAKMAKIGKALGVHYIITGSITKFGGEQNDKGGSLKGIRVGLGKHKTEVEVSARLIDTTTGEIMLAAKGHGESKKGGGFKFSKGGTGYGQDQSDFKASAIGEAQEAAIADLAAKIVAKKSVLN